MWDQRFLSTTRGQVVALLWRGPRTVDQLAATLGITDNAVRAHLASLERDGLVRQSGARRSHTLRKPAYVYDVTPAAERLFPKAYAPVLRVLLDTLSERLPPEAFTATLRDVGRRMAHDAGPRPAGDPVQRAADLLVELGGIVDVEDGRVLHGYSCPLAAAVPDHPELCQAIEALLEELIGAPVSEHCDRSGRPRCCFEITPPV